MNIIGHIDYIMHLLFANWEFAMGYIPCFTLTGRLKSFRADFLSTKFLNTASPDAKEVSTFFLSNSKMKDG